MRIFDFSKDIHLGPDGAVSVEAITPENFALSGVLWVGDEPHILPPVFIPCELCEGAAISHWSRMVVEDTITEEPTLTTLAVCENCLVEGLSDGTILRYIPVP